MRLFSYIICVLIGLLVGCQIKKEPRPVNVLPPVRMAPLLAMAHVMEGQMIAQRLPFGEGKPMFDHRLDSALRVSGTDTATFSRSFRYYTAHVEALDSIYQAVVDSLAIREAKGK